MALMGKAISFLTGLLLISCATLKVHQPEFAGASCEKHLKCRISQKGNYAICDTIEDCIIYIKR